MREVSFTSLSAALPTIPSIHPGEKKTFKIYSSFVFRVKLLTTGNNTVRFNPNFYKTGKVKKKEFSNMDQVSMWATGVSFNPGHLGRTFLEPCTLPLLTPHLHSGAGSPPSSFLFDPSFPQSLMTDKPYHNEPGYETERFGGDVKR